MRPDAGAAVDGALDRVRLLQAASLPDPRATDALASGRAPTAWSRSRSRCRAGRCR